MNKEIQSLYKNQTWEFVKPSQSQKIIGYKQVYKRKDVILEVDDVRFKARLVANGWLTLIKYSLKL